ncbi:MAG: hypothetical protein H7840_00450 [Alphaproteobacteria bacterium]
MARTTMGLAAMLAPLVGYCAQALAADVSTKNLPKIDKPGHWRKMGHDDATTTSKCVGNPVTPLCAVETVRACFVRVEDLLCGIAMGLDGPAGMVSRKKSVGITLRYRITGARILRDRDIPPNKRDGKWSWKAGDVQIDMKATKCYDGRCQKEIRQATSTTYDVRKYGNRWVVIEWDTPRW